MFNETVTIYNYRKEDGVEKWYRSILENCCQWNETQQKNISSDRKIDVAQSVDLRIIDSKLKKPFKALKEWQALTDEDKPNYWTVDHKSNLDIVVLGSVETEVTDDYTITNIKKDFDCVATVSMFSDYTKSRGLKNYLIGGR